MLRSNTPATYSPHYRNRLHLALAGLAVLMVGCSHSSRDLTGTLLPRVQLAQCENFGGNFAVPFDQAQAALPEGFEPLPTTGGSTAGAVFFITAVRCADGVFDGQSIGEVRLAYAELPAVPSAEFAIEGQNDFVVPVLFTATPDVVAEAFAANDFGQSGPGTVVWTDQPGGSGTEVQFTQGNAMVTLSGSIPPEPVSNFGGGEFVLFGTKDRAVTRTITGYFGPASSVRGPVTLQASGGPALLSAASQSSRGFASNGYTFGFALE